MTDTQSQAYVTDFTNQLQIKAQQMKSKFRGNLLEMPVKGDYFDHINLSGVQMTKIESRFAPRELGDPTLQRRGVLVESFEQALPVADIDALRSLVSVNSGYSDVLAAGAAREIDRSVALAATGSVLTGKSFSTTVSASDDGVQSVTAGSGLTYGKVLETIAKFKSKDIDEEIFFAITDVQWSTLMTEVEVISTDYNKKMAAETGIIPGILGAKFIVFGSNPETGDSIIQKPSTRTCFAFAKSGLKLGLLSDIKVEYQPRYDIQGGTNQLVVSASFGAIRTEGAKVVQINVTE
jgi:hypothetical protein